MKKRKERVVNLFEHTVQSRVYRCPKCNWSGHKPNLLYQKGPRKQVCPICMTEVERLSVDTGGEK